ncbi:DUF3499 domain-containing protein [Tessaracoccus oleiagri]|uniref:DUF3499 domain-containing protein n=1 Tax=Tessaracoccus oleiagri TaxID=686624 RepID=A0A1G9JIB8_9ACTN|nr:DUF3499 domain-containing protein [Tessaracoccus oleiagri]SDL37238.1 Protein of unknown function [Tessaracoccus oleiagri]
MRRCTRTACLAPAVATLTYVYADSTAVLGPLALTAEPGTYDLCIKHAESTSVPRGWEVIRLPHSEQARRTDDEDDDLMALANAVRQIGLREDDPMPEQFAAAHAAPAAPAAPTGAGRPQLRVVRD